MFGKAIGWSVVALPAVWSVSALAAWSRPCGAWVGGWGCFCTPGSASPNPTTAPGGGPCPLRVCAGGAAGGAGKGCSPPTVARVVSARFPVILGPVSRTPGTAVPSVRVSLCPGRWAAFSALLMRLSIFPCFQTFFSLCDLFTSWPILRGLLGRFTSQQTQPWCEQVHVACVA